MPFPHPVDTMRVGPPERAGPMLLDDQRLAGRRVSTRVGWIQVPRVETTSLLGTALRERRDSMGAVDHRVGIAKNIYWAEKGISTRALLVPERHRTYSRTVPPSATPRVSPSPSPTTIPAPTPTALRSTLASRPQPCRACHHLLSTSTLPFLSPPRQLTKGARQSMGQPPPWRG